MPARPRGGKKRGVGGAVVISQGGDLTSPLAALLSVHEDRIGLCSAAS